MSERRWIFINCDHWKCSCHFFSIEISSLYEVSSLYAQYTLMQRLNGIENVDECDLESQVYANKQQSIYGESM